MASEQFGSFINGKRIASAAAYPGSPLAKQLEGISDGAYRVVTLTDNEHLVPDVEKPSHKLLHLTKDEDPSLLDAYTEWVYHENEWIIVGSTALNPDSSKTRFLIRLLPVPPSRQSTRLPRTPMARLQQPRRQFALRIHRRPVSFSFKEASALPTTKSIS